MLSRCIDCWGALEYLELMQEAARADNELESEASITSGVAGCLTGSAAAWQGNAGISQFLFKGVLESMQDC